MFLRGLCAGLFLHWWTTNHSKCVFLSKLWQLWKKTLSIVSVWVVHYSTMYDLWGLTYLLEFSYPLRGLLYCTVLWPLTAKTPRLSLVSTCVAPHHLDAAALALLSSHHGSHNLPLTSQPCTFLSVRVFFCLSRSWWNYHSFFHPHSPPPDPPIPVTVLTHGFLASLLSQWWQLFLGALFQAEF